MEKAGRSVKSMLQRSDPFKSGTCGRALCFVCGTEKKGLCDKNGVNYVITCLGCENSGQKGEYIGETSKNAYTRGKQHQDVFPLSSNSAQHECIRTKKFQNFDLKKKCSPPIMLICFFEIHP